MNIEPGSADFAAAYASGRAQVVWTRVIDDLETPVSAYLKIAAGRPYGFLFESVEGGAWRGRYSIVAMNPDLVWRCRGDLAEIAEGDRVATGDIFTPQSGGALDSLRDLVAQGRGWICRTGLPPMSAGLFGALGYDMIRLSRTPAQQQSRPVRPARRDHDPAIDHRDFRLDSAGDHHRHHGQAVRASFGGPRPMTTACRRLRKVVDDLAKSRWRGSANASSRRPRRTRSSRLIDRDAYGLLVERAKEYIRAGDIFQVVPSHRFAAPFALNPFALYRSLRRTNPSPFLVLSELPRLPAGRLLAQKSWCACGTARSPSARSQERGGAGATPAEDHRPGGRVAGRSQGARRTPDAAGPWAQRRRPGRDPAPGGP